MKIITAYLLGFSLTCLIVTQSYAQFTTSDSLDPKYFDWQNKDYSCDKIPGVSTDRAYNELLKNKTPKKKIIVAVIDGGIDTAHADLQGKFWKNADEIPGNGIDDDNNGYIDDIYGWNFIGNSSGKNIHSENIEPTRVLRKYDSLFNKIASINEVPSNQKDQYIMYIKAKKLYSEKYDKYSKEAAKIAKLEKKLTESETLIKEYLKKDTINLSDLNTIKSEDSTILKAKTFLENLYSKGINLSSFPSLKETSKTYLEKYLNYDFNPRPSLIGDNPEDITDNRYGNNDVTGPDASHGTLSAGLIAANRNNGFGVNGIASHVEIMAIRVVPDGDERDKDVALAIRYAVDNGANIISMSFGKNISPEKPFVDDAIKYAESHNILLVNSAGNNGQNNDTTDRYPSKFFNDKTIAKTMITVGATNNTMNAEYAAKFSNYGKTVDLFAPGVNVSSTDNRSRYSLTTGTSFSCPVVSGVAALVWSYYPELTAAQLKDILLKSVSKQGKMKVYEPNLVSKEKTIVRFKKLCLTGGTVNAYNALKLAAKKLKE